MAQGVTLEAILLTCSFLQIVNPKGEMKGSAITGPVGKEAAELWPVSYPFLACQFGAIFQQWKLIYSSPAYCIQLWCRHVSTSTRAISLRVMDMEGVALHRAVTQLHSGYKLNAFYATKVSLSTIVILVEVDESSLGKDIMNLMLAL